MSDETNVNAGSETSGETEVQSDQGGTEATTETESTTETSETQSTADAGGATGDSANKTSGETEVQSDQGGTEATTETSADTSASRTGFVTGARPGDTCTCPDGRTGTVHKFDEGLVCIPNVDQG